MHTPPSCFDADEEVDNKEAMEDYDPACLEQDRAMGSQLSELAVEISAAKFAGPRLRD
jgi:hypothetical protein